MADLGEAARRHALPLWWVQGVAVEHLPCRRFARGDLWEFDFGRVGDDVLDAALEEHRLLVTRPLLHNVRVSAGSKHYLTRLSSAVPVPAAPHRPDLVPEGEVGPHRYLVPGSSLQAWDPKLGFGSHCVVREGSTFHQWEVAEWQPVAGRAHGAWKSSTVDLGDLDDVHLQLERLRDPRHARRPGQTGWLAFHNAVVDFYAWLEDVRRPIRAALADVHQERLAAATRSDARSSASADLPPELGWYEDFRVRDGRLQVRLHAEALAYRSAVRACRRAVEAAPGPYPAHADVVADRMQAISLAGVFLESFVNVVGSERVDGWDVLDALPPEDKWRLVFHSCGTDGLYDAGREPFRTLRTVLAVRRRWAHRPTSFRPEDGGRVGSEGWLADGECRAFVEALPEALRSLVVQVSSRADRDVPAWLAAGDD